MSLVAPTLQRSADETARCGAAATQLVARAPTFDRVRGVCLACGMESTSTSHAERILDARLDWISACDAHELAQDVASKREIARLAHAASDAYDAYVLAREAAPNLQPVEDVETGRVWIEPS